MPRVLYPEFRQQLETTKYPFSARASLHNNAGQSIVEGSFLDAHLYPIGGKARLYLSKVTVTTTTMTFILGDEATPELASGVVSLGNLENNVILADSYGRPAGILISERVRLASFQAWGIGTHEFNVDQTEFAATCCMPTPEVAVRGILLEDGSVLSGQIWIVGDDGVVIRHDYEVVPVSCQQDMAAVDVIRVDIVGDPLFRRRLCTDASLFNTPHPIRKIRIVNGDYVFESSPEMGELTIQTNDGLTSDPVLRIHPTEDGLVFETIGSPQSATSAKHDTAITLPPSYLR